MSISTTWLLAKFWISQTPELALEIVKQLKPDKWKMSVNGVAVASKNIKFDVRGTLTTRRLVAEITWIDSLGTNHKAVAGTRFKNDGSDSIVVDDVEMVNVNFNFTSKPLRKDFSVKLAYRTPQGESQLILLENKF